jgi:uncharacterized lipoprotein YddW (UPF0748 family)
MMSGSALCLFARLRRALLPVLLIASAILQMATVIRAASPPPHASWIPGSALESPDGIRRAVSAAVAAGAGAIVASVPLYPDGGPDRFLQLVRQAHEQRLLVFASVDLERAALPNELPASRQHVLYQHPEWLMVPRALAPELLTIDPRSPEYLGRLARWTRTHEADGIYVSPLADAAPPFLASAVSAVVKRYPIDGVQLDAARYPAYDFDYGLSAIDAFRRSIRPSLSPASRATVDADEALDPFAYFNAFPDAWRQFRQTRMTRMVETVRAAIADALPGIPIIAAISGLTDTDRIDHFQDWRSWLDRRLIDAVSIRSGTTTTIIIADATSLVATADTAAASGGR